MDLLKFEQQYPKGSIVVGIDEVGRGPWAGPVVAAAVVYDSLLSKQWLTTVKDSKQLTSSKREQLYQEFIKEDLYFGIGQASVQEIDTINILQATFLAMSRAVQQLPITPEYILIDGKQIPPFFTGSCQAIIKGDQKSLTIASASVIAKVYRDRLMATLHQTHPEYGWNHNKGYGTRYHQQALSIHGITLHHRKSFKPIQKVLAR